MSDLLTRLCVIILVLLTIVTAHNITDRYLTMGPTNNYQTRQQRLLSFNTETEGEISIEMQFAVPFIKIPVDKAVHATKGAVANINLAAVVVSAAIALVTGFVLPALLKLFSYKYMQMDATPAVEMGMGRDLKGETSEVWRFLSVMDQALLENNLDTTTCMQKMVCWTVRESSNKVSNGLATSTDKIIDGIVTNEWVNKLFDGTPVQSAIKNGLDGANCSNEYNSCKLGPKTFVNLLKQFSNTINLT